MKKTLLYVVLAILIGGWLGTMMIRDPGYVLISYDGAVLQTSLWFMILATVLTVVALYVIVRLTRALLQSGNFFGMWRGNQRRNKARSQTTTGFINLIEGNWLRARRYLSAAAGDSDTPLLNYLGAARASHEMGEYGQRDGYLKSAHEAMPEAELAVGITQAQLQLSTGQWEQCLATLKRLPARPHVMKMLAQVYKELKDWRSLWALLPDLKKKQIEDDAVLVGMERETLSNILNNMLSRKTGAVVERLASLREVWKSSGRHMKEDDSLVSLYAQCLYSVNAGPEADKIVLRRLRAAWSDELLDLYGTAYAPRSGAFQDDALPANPLPEDLLPENPPPEDLLPEKKSKRLQAAESLLKKQQHNARLHLCIARLCMACGEVEKGKGYYRSSLSLGETAEALRELGRQLSAEGDHRGSSELLLRALAIEDSGSSNAPSGVGSGSAHMAAIL